MFQTSPIFKAFLETLVFYTDMIQQVYTYVRSSSWPSLMFFVLQITKKIEISLGELEKKWVAMGTEIIAIGVVHEELIITSNYVWFLLQIDQDSSEVIFG